MKGRLGRIQVSRRAFEKWLDMMRYTDSKRIDKSIERIRHILNECVKSEFRFE